MAANYNQSIERVSLRVMVDRERNKVLYAEAGKDVVDALLIFLTLPLGIARLIAKQSNIEAVTVGSLSSLYQSVTCLDEQYLWTDTCKEMLLQPRNSMEAHCQHLKLNIDDTEPTQHFKCKTWHLCSTESGCLLSTFSNKKCSCGQVMDKLAIPEECLIREKGFVKETASFIICDNLYVMPNVIGTSLRLLQNLGVGLHNIQAVEEKIVHVTKKEVLDLLKLSMLSNTPLTDFVFKNISLNSINQSGVEIEDVSPCEARQMTVKIQVRKSTREVLYAEAEEDFADLLLSFLTFPLGAVLHMLQGLSSVNCIDNLYNSMTELSSDRYLISQDLKNKLVNPPCAAQFELRNQILPIAATSLPTLYYHIWFSFDNPPQKTLNTTPKIETKCIRQINRPLCFVDPKFCMSKASSPGEYTKGPSMFMVTDHLVLTPMSSVAALSYLIRSNVPLSDLEEMVIRIGVKEGLSILKASLTSSSALTNGLSQFIRTNLGALGNI